MSIRLRYGLIGGILCSSSYLYIFNDAVSKPASIANPYYMFLVYGCLLWALVFALIRTKKEMPVLDFKTALRTGISISILCGFLVAAAIFIYLLWINPQYSAAQKIKYPEYSDWKVAFLLFNKILFPGAFMSLILSLIFKTRWKS